MTPTSRPRVIGSSGKTSAASTMTSSGTAPLRIAAMADATDCSAQVISENGITILTAAMTSRCRYVRGFLGSGSFAPATTRRNGMGKFMDVHNGFFGVSAEQLRDAHNRDLAIQDDETVVYERAWLDPEAGKVFCLATGPSKEAVMRIHQRAGHPTPEVYEIMAEV